MVKTRSKGLDIAKGIGILIVVWAHAQGPASTAIYQFHMPLFFIISGYLFNSRNTVKEFVWRKIKSLYIPFVFWNFVFIALRSLYNIFSGVSTLAYTAKSTVKTVLMLDKDMQLGAIWFLGALFVMSILYKLCDTYINPKKYKRRLITLIFTGLAVFGFTVDLPYFLSRTLILGMFFAFGYVVQENREKLSQYNKPIVAIVAMAMFVVIAMNNSADMGHNKYTSPVQFVIGACCASYFVIWLSNVIADSAAKLLKPVQGCFEYLGRRSIDIVIWQFVFFNVVIAAQLLLAGLPISQIFDYGHIFETDNGWWIAYTLAGTIIPLLWCDFLRIGPWGRFLKKIHAV